ncbi:hypothetical protein [Intrasporangium sp. DVR]|uniref:hypothetical protein n=1 Tax=Intrasporangium sp. DVR TaxID=3127867 RepID=UPI003340F4FF
MVEAEPPEHVENGAQVIDREAGVTYRATIARTSRSAAHLTSLQIDVPPGARIDGRFLASVPTERIAQAVAQYLDAAAESGPGDLVILPPAAVRGRGFVPDLDELAARYRDPSRTRADVVAEYESEFGVSRATVDRWISKAREAGLIPAAQTGRPSKKQTPGGDRQPGRPSK